MIFMNIYDELVSAQENLRLVDDENELLRFVKVEPRGVYYQIEFLRKYCPDSVVTDVVLRKHIADLESAAEKSIAR